MWKKGTLFGAMMSNSCDIQRCGFGSRVRAGEGPQILPSSSKALGRELSFAILSRIGGDDDPIEDPYLRLEALSREVLALDDPRASLFSLPVAGR